MTRTLLSLLGLAMLWSCGSSRTAPESATPERAAPLSSEAEGPLKHRPAATSPEIRAEDLMTRLYIFADDSMLGREAGTEGNVRARTTSPRKRSGSACCLPERMGATSRPYY